MTLEPYGVLGLPRNAGYDAVRRAYRRLAAGSHPDTNGPSGVDRFISVQAAYHAISQERQGAAYGSTGAAIVPRSVGVTAVTSPTAPPPPSPPVRVDLLRTLMPVRVDDATEAYLRHLRIAPARLVDVCG